MTDRYSTITVALERDTRDDDAEHIIAAIRQFKNVADVTGNVASHEQYVAEVRERNKWREKLMLLAHGKPVDADQL